MLIALLVLTSTGHAETIDKEISVHPDVMINISSLCGQLRFVAWDQPSVHIQGTTADDSFSARGAQSTVLIKSTAQDGKGCPDLMIQMPPNASIHATGETTDVSIEGLFGTAVLESLSGHSTVSGAPESVSVQSLGGDVRITGAKEVEVGTVAGNINLDNIGHSITATTVSGDLTIISGKLHRIKAESVSGNLVLSGGLDHKAKVNAETHNGFVRFTLPASMDGRFSLETFSGKIKGDIKGEVKTSKMGTKHQFQVGTNGGSYQLASFSGDVIVERP